MPITHLITIDEQDVSPWVMQVGIDMVIPTNSQENNVQQADVTLSNVSGRFDGAFGGWIEDQHVAGGGQYIGETSKIVILLISYEWSATSGDEPIVYSVIAFTGVCQKLDIGYMTVKIHAATEDTECNGYIPWDLHKHNGPKVGDLVYEVFNQFNQKAVGKIRVPEIRKRELQFLQDQSGKGVLDYLADICGQECFKNESGQWVFTSPYQLSGENPSYTGRMKMPMQSESAVGLCNKVKVVAASFLNPQDPGAEHLPSDAPRYETDLADLAEVMANENGKGGVEAATQQINDYGWIRAPVAYIPDLTTPEECKKAAKLMLARYMTYWDRSIPSVVGRIPMLQSKISYEYPRLINDQWIMSPTQTGRVVRCKTNYGPKTGWYSQLEIMPFELSSANKEEIYNEPVDPTTPPAEIWPKTSPTFDSNKPFTDPVSGAIFSSYQARINQDGSVQYRAIGTIREGYGTSSGWYNAGGVWSIPADVQVGIDAWVAANRGTAT